MTHVAIYGQTESGKSTLAKMLAAQFMAKGHGVLAYDPVNDPEWKASFKTNNFDIFLEYYWKSELCMSFIDEASRVCKHHAADAIQTATMGRHKGHRNYYISQRANLIDVTIRDQCSHLFLFNSGLKDSILHAEEWNQPELKNATSLAKGEYYYCKKMGEFSRHKLF